ncbi:MAG TPA: transcription antitermination factor NusB [Bacteroidia bacterium]|nr:transcription antitermination factor NusB [Bacteroidia bacterium]
MLNRRYLRIKVMQGLYIYFQSHNHDVPKGENELMRSIDKIYDLYLLLLQFLVDLRGVAANSADDGRNKRLPSKEDLNPNLRFVQNPVLLQLEENAALAAGIRQRKINWSGQMEILRRTFVALRASEEYQEYMNSEDDSYDFHREFILYVFKKYIADSDALESFIEEQSLYWPNDLNMAVAPMILKTLESMHEGPGTEMSLLPLYKDPTEDKAFVVDLYRKTIINDKESEQMIGEKTRNWEVERIAMMDVLLMKMAITELIHFQSIPVKVSLNEYIEISKLYSTPKSKVFINGVLDKLVVDLKEKELVKKTGRGLIE